MGQRWNIWDSNTRANFNSYVDQQLLAGKKVCVEFVDQKRTIDQNSISHAWYADVSRQLEDRSPLDVKCESKAYCGVPILLSEEPKFREKWERIIKNNLTVEQKIELMEWFPVTSLMSKKQLSYYLEKMREYWGRQGVTLLFPDDYRR